MKELVVAIALLIGIGITGCQMEAHKPIIPCGCECKVHFKCDSNLTKKGK